MSGKTLVESTLTIVVGTVIPDVLEHRVLLLHLLVETDMECAELRHDRGRRTTAELRVVAQTVDSVIIEELGSLIHI